MPKFLQTDILAVLQQLGSDWNLLKDPVPSDHPAIKGLDSLLDPGRKNAILRFLSALQQLGNIVTEEEDLRILVALGFTGFEQFGDLDQVGCEDCCSVTSPAAYFVDLLGLLKNQPATANVTIPLPSFDGSVSNTGSVPRGSILEKLFNRRPDLGNLLVSCRNTNAVVPYIDLVNEVLESALRYLQTNNNMLEKRGFRIPAHNADDVEKDTQDSSDYEAAYYPSESIESSSSANKAALLSDAANIDYALYDTVIVHKVAPSSVFPYDHSQDSLERYLAASRTNLPEMVSVFQRFAKSNGPSRVVIARANASQTLSMSHAHFLSLSMESYFDLQLATIETGNPPLQVDE
ncbi:hypothetical protein CGMCC3_g16420 [Colletotrichum fructicola]|nr:uncharacterized protein CGMCC3_g16420 [Colletotrichum fructicola]KAE9567425.1 hypothetical protein CGMCC3_g16420 [Colletotrichum fructicola]